jgi:hypothetical protein
MPTSQEMARRGKLGAWSRLAREDPVSMTEKARSAFLASFEREVDPDGVLPPAERSRRAEYARKSYYARLAAASARKRKTPAS